MQYKILPKKTPNSYKHQLIYSYCCIILAPNAFNITGQPNLYVKKYISLYKNPSLKNNECNIHWFLHFKYPNCNHYNNKLYPHFIPNKLIHAKLFPNPHI